MGEGQKNVPKLRFKGYEDAWEQRKLGEVCERVVRKNKNYESDLPLTIASQFGLIDQRDFFGKIVAAKDMSNYYLLKKGEFAYNKSYSKGFDFGSIKRLNNYELGCLSTLYICFKIALNRVESDYLEVYFDTLNWYKDVMSICAEGARNHGLLNVDTKAFFEEVNVDIPREILEQKNIASSLEKVEKLITLHQRKYDALKSMKKTLLSKMFPKNGEDVPEIRFKEFTDAWEQRKLESEIKDFIVPMRDKPKEFGGDIPWTRIEDIEGKYLNDTLSNQYVTEETVQLMNLNIIPKDSLIVSSSATFGVVAIVTRDLVTNQTFIGLVPNDKNTLEFWYSFFHSDEARKYMSLESVGSTIFYIAREKFEKMPVKVPKIKEMMVIGEHFNKLDQLITLHQRKFDELKNMKKTLLQQMFV